MPQNAEILLICWSKGQNPSTKHWIFPEMQGYKVQLRLVQDGKSTEFATLFDLFNALRQVIVLYRWSISDAELWPFPLYVTPELENILSQASQSVVTNGAS